MAHVAGLQRLRGGNLASQAINLGTGRGASVREVVETVRAVTHRNFSIKESGRRPGDPARLVAAVDRARRLLDWEPEHSTLLHIVKTAWSWLEKRRTTAMDRDDE